jgi:hypothetical protein
MTQRRCYAMDLPRGALLVEHAVTILRVDVKARTVSVLGADGDRYAFGIHDRVLIDDDTPIYVLPGADLVPRRRVACAVCNRVRLTTATNVGPVCNDCFADSRALLTPADES